eukprot:Gb_21148 [translate_table: standard]
MNLIPTFGIRAGSGGEIEEQGNFAQSQWLKKTIFAALCDPWWSGPVCGERGVPVCKPGGIKEAYVSSEDPSIVKLTIKEASVVETHERGAHNVKDTYQEHLDNALAIINLVVIPTIKTNINKSTTPKEAWDTLKLKEVRNQLEGVGETIVDKEMVMKTIISLPWEGPTNLGPFITSLCTQGRVGSIPFNEFEGLLLQEKNLRNLGTSKGDYFGAYAIKHQGKAHM